MHTSKKHVPFSTVFTSPPAFLQLPAVGVDIADRAVRYIQLAHKGASRRVAAAGTRSLPEGAVVGGEIVDMEALVGVLRKLRSDLGASTIRIALPEEKAYIFQTVASKEVSHTEARSSVEAKLEEHVPLPPQEAIFDFDYIPHDSVEGAAEESELAPVSVTVYPRALVDAYYEAVVAAGFLPISFEAKMQATARAVLGSEDLPSSVLLVSLGVRTTTIAIANHNVVQFTATVEVGEDTLSDAIEKMQEGDNERAALVGAFSALRDEINRHVTYWDTHTDHSGHEPEPVGTVVLCGARAESLADYLQQTIELPVHTPNVWRHAFSFNEVIPEISAEKSLRFPVAVGLALRDGF